MNHDNWQRVRNLLGILRLEKTHLRLLDQRFGRLAIEASFGRVFELFALKIFKAIQMKLGVRVSVVSWLDVKRQFFICNLFSGDGLAHFVIAKVLIEVLVRILDTWGFSADGVILFSV